MLCLFVSKGFILLESELPIVQNKTATTNRSIKMPANAQVMTQDRAVGLPTYFALFPRINER
jgi:hypothetical protein